MKKIPGDELMWGVAEMIQEGPARFRVHRYADRERAVAALCTVPPVLVPWDGQDRSQVLRPLVCRDYTPQSLWRFESTRWTCPT